MEKIWNALRYGDSQTRKCIGGVLFFSVAAVMLIVISGLMGKFGLFIVGILFAAVAIIISQTFSLVDEDFVAEVDSKGTKETVKSVSAQMEHKKSSSAKIDNPEDEIHEKKTMKEKPVEFARYNEVVLKKVLRKYHVKKDHRPIIIDSSKTYRIKECPAFIWRAHNKVYLLLLEKEPRKICISRDLIRHMEYEPSVRADKSLEYLAFRDDNLITSVFEGFLPDYFDSKVKQTRLKYKNLYKIYPDICISNRSAATVMDLLILNFMPDDKITQSDKLNGFFKRVYAAHIMYQDRVYSITEYKEKVEQILKELCYADIPGREFEVTLENLVKGRMISQEYADHYSDMKRKIDTSTSKKRIR